MKKLIYVLILPIFFFTQSTDTIFNPLRIFYGEKSLVPQKYACFVLPIQVGAALRLLPFLSSHKPIKTPSWLPNFLNITPHNIREGLLQAIKMSLARDFLSNDYCYSFFHADNVWHTQSGFTGSSIDNEIYETVSPFNSIPAAMIIEGFNGMMIDNSLDRGGNFAKQHIKSWEKKHHNLHPIIKWALVCAGRTAGSFAWAYIIGTLRTLKNSETHAWKLPSRPSLGYGVRLDITGIDWKDIKLDFVIRA